jgi:hypothetical protein
LRSLLITLDISLEIGHQAIPILLDSQVTDHSIPLVIIGLQKTRERL